MKKKTTNKGKLHPRNRHATGYEFNQLSRVYPPLEQFVAQNKYQTLTIDFSDAKAVKALNLALLKQFYRIDNWDIPDGYLCPPIPGRVDYIHYLADLLKATNGNKIPDGNKVSVLDIGTGASCIYPILAQREYHWHCVASDIDPISVNRANEIISLNDDLAESIECRLQPEPNHIFKGIIKPNERYEFTLCNPPFHRSLAEANEGTQRKWKNLGKSKTLETSLNFGGQKAELWCPGGELSFIRKMINESKQYQEQVLWFTCLVAKKDHINAIKLSLKKAHINNVKIVNMEQGQKLSRFIAWSFLTDEQQEKWCNKIF